MRHLFLGIGFMMRRCDVAVPAVISKSMLRFVKSGSRKKEVNSVETADVRVEGKLERRWWRGRFENGMI